MGKNQNNDRDEHINDVQKKIDVVDWIAVLLKWRKLVIINMLVVTILAVIISLLLPNWYRATASILPPKEQDLYGPLDVGGNLLKNITGISRIGGLRQGLGAYNYLAILKSRSAMEDMVNKFDLISVYGLSNNSTEKAVNQLRENVSFELQDEDYITIEVFDKNPQRAADIANYFVEVLNNISIQLGTQEARNNKEFVEKRLEKSKEELRNAEEALRDYQEKSGVMIAPEQNMVSVSAIAELYGMKAKKEVESAIMERMVTKDNSALQQLKLELSELNKKINSFPLTAVKSIRLYRDLAIQQKIVEYLIPLYEQAKIDEQKDVPVILVLDKAVPPEKKDKPKRLLIVILVVVLTFVFSIMMVLIIEGYNRFKTIHPEKYRQFQSMFSNLRSPKASS